MTPGDTIAAIASGPGRSPRGLVRLSGPAAFDALEAVTGASGSDGATFAVLRVKVDGGAARPLPVQVLRSSGPRTYTGEDTAEILMPGNPALLERVLGLFLGFPGVRLAEAGEFSARAYLAGKLTLSQAEGIADVIAAASEMELACAKAAMREGHGREYEAWAERVATMLALVEAGVDFSDQEDVVAISPADLRARLNNLAENMAVRLGRGLGSEETDWRPRVVLLGKPNAGKSTLFNALLGRRRAVVSDVAGTTRDILAEEWRGGEASLTVVLADLPGIDAALGVSTIDREAQLAAKDAALAADVVLWCDPTGRFETAGAVDVRSTARVIRVMTKVDLPVERAAGECLRVCAIDGHGIGELRRRIEAAAWGAPVSAGGQGSPAPLLPRHRRALAQALSVVQGVASSIDERERHLTSPELVATNLREALDALGPLTGRISADDVIGRVFSTFCIGK